MLYIATPYAHENPAVMQRRYQTSCRAAAKLMKVGIVVFNPLANTIPAVELGGLDLTHDEFVAIDLQILHRCDEVLIVGQDGWEKSDGVKREMFEALKLQKPITLIGENDIELLPKIPDSALTFLHSSIFTEKT